MPSFGPSFMLFLVFLLSETFSVLKTDFWFWRQIQISPKISATHANISGNESKSKNPLRWSRSPNKCLPEAKKHLALACFMPPQFVPQKVTLDRLQITKVNTSVARFSRKSWLLIGSSKFRFFRALARGVFAVLNSVVDHQIHERVETSQDTLNFSA